MNKKLMAVAIAAALSPLAALADPSGVTLYGNLNVAAERVSGLNPNSDGRETRLTDSSSRIGVRGAEKLGSSGLEGFFQVETLVAPEGNNGNGGAALGWASRNSGVGLRGAFGEILGGRWDTYYTDHAAADISLYGRSGLASFGNTILGSMGRTGAAAAALGMTPAATTAGSGQLIGGRYANVIRYATPNLAGFQGIATIGASENGQDSGLGKKTGINLRYANGPFFGGVSWLRLGKDVGTSDYNKGLKVAAAYTAPSATKIGLVYEELKAPVTNTELKRKATLLSLSQNLGAVDLIASYTKAKEIEGCLVATACANSGSKMFQLGGAYNFSKRTLAYLTYIKVDNEANAAYNFFSLGGTNSTIPGSTGLGTDPKTIQLGINHAF
ncbi:MAG: porin [Burkholderiales bacterium]